MAQCIRADRLQRRGLDAGAHLARHRIEQTRSGVPRLVKRIEPKLRQARIDGRSEEEYNDLMMLFDHSGGARRDELLY